MRGMLKTKSPGTQLLIVISIALVGFFLISIIGTLILAGMSGMSITQLADPDKWNYNDSKVVFLIRGMQIVQFISLFSIPTFFCAWLFSSNTKEYLGLRAPFKAAYYPMGILAMVVALPFVNTIGEINRHVHFPPGLETWLREKEDEASRMIQALLLRHTVKDLLLNIFCIAGLAAIGEELLFRGLLQRLFIKIFRNHWVGIIVAAFLFSAMHLQFFGFLPRFALGILLGLIFWYSGSLWVAMLAHFIYDAALIVLAYFYPSMIKDENTVKLANLAFLAVVSLCLIVLVVMWMKKNTGTHYNRVYADDALPVKDNPF